jgi:DNA-directed RNA polymerase subunit F
MEVKNEKFVSWVEAKNILVKKEKEKELGYEQKNSLEYLRKFCKLTEKEESEIREELKKIGKLSEKQIVNIINFLPKNLDELRILFADERVVLSEDEKNKIIEIVKNKAK